MHITILVDSKGSFSKGHLSDASVLELATSRLRDGPITDAPLKWPRICLKIGSCQMVGSISGNPGCEPPISSHPEIISFDK